MSKDIIIIVHNLEHAKAALQLAAEFKQTVVLRSAPAAAAYLSPPVFKAMIDEAVASSSPTTFKAVLDCGNQSGMAMNALRHGIKCIRTDVEKDVFAKLVSIAEQSEATVLPYNDDPVLDLQTVDDIETACRDWFKKCETSQT